MKAVKTSKHAAYETFPGMSREEAEDKGYVVVENSADGMSPVYGRYLNTKTGAALETLRDEDKREPVPASGDVTGGVATAQKGSLVNPNDPVVHGTADNNPHEDGAQPNDEGNADLELEGYDPNAEDQTSTRRGRQKRS
jgi:hypothetical protein